MNWVFIIFILNILLIYGFASEDENLCKRKPYLIFCREQNIDFAESRMQNQNSQVIHPRPKFKAATSSGDMAPLERPLLPAKEREQLGVEESGSQEDEAVVVSNGGRSTQRPIDLSRPNAEDVAREMGELQRDTTTTTESNEIDAERVFTTTQIKNNPLLAQTFVRHKRSSPSSLPPPPSVVAFSSSNSTTKFNNKRQHDWVYLDDTDDLDYIAYRRRRARLLRKLNDLDSDQLHYHNHRTTTSYSNPYSSYGYPNSGYYSSNNYATNYPSYGYSPSYNYPNAGYMGGYGYRPPFTFGIGSGLNIGLPYGWDVGVGSGLGVSVG